MTYQMLILVLASITWAAYVDPSFESRIQKSCVESALANDQKVKNPEEVCSCIARKHMASAKKEASDAEALAQLKWVAEFYEIKDPKALQKHVDSDLANSSYDEQVALECAEQATKKGKKK